MGYGISYRGQLKFVEPLNLKQLKKLQTILGKDVRECSQCQKILKELSLKFGNKDYKGLDYIELSLTEDWDGLVHDGSENYNCLVEQINFVIAFMGDVQLTGELEERGEEFGDDSIIRMVDNVAVRIESNDKKYTFEDLMKVVLCTHFEKDLFDQNVIDTIFDEKEMQDYFEQTSIKFLKSLGYEHL